MDKVVLYEKYRLIERPDADVVRGWKGAHLLLFFLAFVFGSFCTFCFHMLAYMFDDKCVLFPNLRPLETTRHSLIYEVISLDKHLSKFQNIPIEMLSTQWVDRSVCHLPTFVPLVSGIFGLVWTTVFLMFSTTGVAHTGLQRPWRVMLPVFVFSVIMGALCTYTSAVTYAGLQQLCIKLSEVTGGDSCTYTVNVATLAYERHIRGVYQATRLTMISAWLHTACWLMSALLVLLRVALVVDFQLVCVRATLTGNIERVLEQNERQIRVVSPEYEPSDSSDRQMGTQTKSNTEIISIHKRVEKKDEMSSTLSQKSSVRATFSEELRDYFAQRYITKILYDLLDYLPISLRRRMVQSSLPEGSTVGTSEEFVTIDLQDQTSTSRNTAADEKKSEAVDKHVAVTFPEDSKKNDEPATSGPKTKSIMKTRAVQTDDGMNGSPQKSVNILESKDSSDETDEDKKKSPKEKKD